MREFNRIFGIGLGKTGTTSLHHALNHIGIPSIHHPRKFEPHKAEMLRGDFRSVGRWFRERRAFLDHPFFMPEMIPVLEERWPGSLFIYTMRDPYERAVSYARHAYRNRGDPDFTGNMDQPNFKAQFYLAVTHADFVFDFFKTRRNRFLALNIIRGDGWGILCRFLGVPVPDTPFPVSNTAANPTNT